MGADPKASAARKKGGAGLMEGFSPVSPPRIFWNSRKRSVNGRSLEKAMEEESLKAAAGDSNKPKESSSSAVTTDDDTPMADGDGGSGSAAPGELSERRKALFEPLEPPTTRRGPRTPAEELLPPPDFDTASYPKGWLVGKKRKLVNVDVVESMRRIAVQEMNRKDREIDGLNEQLEEDARCLEHLHLQLLDERSKRADVERDNGMLQNQINMLMDMLQDDAAAPEAVEEEDDEGAPRDSS